MYRGNLHIGGPDSGASAPRRWEAPRPTLDVKRFRRLLRNRFRAVARLAGTPLGQASPSSSGMDGGRGAADPEREAPDEEGGAGDGGEEEQEQLQHDQDQDQQHQEEQGNVEAEAEDPEQQEEEEEGAVEDADMEDAGEVVVDGDAEEGQGESEGVDPKPEEEVRAVRILPYHFGFQFIVCPWVSVCNCYETVSLRIANNNRKFRERCRYRDYMLQVSHERN